MRSPTPPGGPVGNGVALRRAALGRFWIAVVLILLELFVGGLAAAALYWSADSTLSGLGSTPFLLLAGSAVAGMVLLTVLAAANRSAARAISAGRPPARAVTLATLGQWLAVIRLAALSAAAILAVAADGRQAVSLADYGMLCFAVPSAVFAVLLGTFTLRATRR